MKTTLLLLVLLAVSLVTANSYRSIYPKPAFTLSYTLVKKDSLGMIVKYIDEEGRLKKYECTIWMENDSYSVLFKRNVITGKVLEKKYFDKSKVTLIHEIE